MLLQKRSDYEKLEDTGCKIMVLETHGGNPYVSVKQIAERWDIAISTARKYVSEIEKACQGTGLDHLKGRYPKESVIGEAQSKRVNEFVFADYYGNRQMLLDPHKARFVDPFYVSRYAALMGYFNRPVVEDETAAAHLPEKRKKGKNNSGISGADLKDALGVLLRAIEQTG